MTRPIDRFVSAMRRENGEEILLETGRPGRMRVGTQERVILAQEIRSDQIELLLRDIIPPEAKRIFQRDGEVAFPYPAPSGAVTIRLRRAGERLSASIAPQELTPPARVVAGRAAEPPRFPAGTGTRAPATVRPPASSGDRTITDLPTIPPKAWRDQSSHRGAIEIPDDDRPAAVQLAHTTQAAALAAADDAAALSLDLSSVDMQPSPALEAAASPKPLEVSDDTTIPGTFSRPVDLSRPVATVKPASNVKPQQPFSRNIDELLLVVIGARASDLHLSAGLCPRMRHDGVIIFVPGHGEPLSSATIESWLMEIAPEKAKKRFSDAGEAEYIYEIPGMARFRVSIFRDRLGVSASLRVIPCQVPTVDQLQLPQVVRDLCALDRGLVVLTGRAGSGRSTTIASMIDLINRNRQDHVITIEDPIEFVHESQQCLVNQREVHLHTESFASALQAVLREDPDVVVVGQMRDLETLSLAIEMAESGLLVLGTLQANTAVGAVDRIIDRFPLDRQVQVRAMLSECLKAVIAQTLCRRVEGGSIAAFEILVSVPAVASLIREGKTGQLTSIMQTGKSSGMQTQTEALLHFVRSGLVEPREALRRAASRIELRAALDRGGPQVV